MDRPDDEAPDALARSVAARARFHGPPRVLTAFGAYSGDVAAVRSRTSPAADLITRLNPDILAKADPMDFNDELEAAIKRHLDAGDMVVCFTGGGGNSLDEWIRKRFA